MQTETPAPPHPARLARLRAHLSQAQASTKAGIALSTLQIAEKGLLSERVAQKLAAAYGCEPEQLLPNRKD